MFSIKLRCVASPTRDLALTFRIPITVILAVLMGISSGCWAQRSASDSGDEGNGNNSKSLSGTGTADAANLTSRDISSSEGSASEEDWPQFLGPRQDGTSVETNIRTDWSNGNLPVVWTRDFGTSYGIGSVVNGRYLQFHRVGNAERLTCLEAATGKEIWSADHPVDYEDMYGYNNGPRTSPTIDGDAVYTMGVAGRLTCREFETGNERWFVDTNERYGVVQNFFGVGCSPLVVDDLVVVMVGGSPDEDQNLPPGRLDRVSPNNSAIVGFDKVTGEERFRTGNYLASYASLRVADLQNGKVILAFVREGLLAIDAVTGKELWMYPWRSDMLESVNAAMPVVDGNQVMISECYQIGASLLEISKTGYKVLRADPENRRLQTFRAHWATPIKVGDYLYGCSGRNPPDSDLRCIDWKTGELMWSDPRRERTSLLYVDGYLIVLGERGGLELIKATPEKYQSITKVDLSKFDRAQPDRLPINYPCWAAPIISHGLMYVRGEQKTICFKIAKED